MVFVDWAGNSLLTVEREFSTKHIYAGVKLADWLDRTHNVSYPFQIPTWHSSLVEIFSLLSLFHPKNVICWLLYGLCPAIHFHFFSSAVCRFFVLAKAPNMCVEPKNPIRDFLSRLSCKYFWGVELRFEKLNRTHTQPMAHDTTFDPHKTLPPLSNAIKTTWEDAPTSPKVDRLCSSGRYGGLVSRRYALCDVRSPFVSFK